MGLTRRVGVWQNVCRVRLCAAEHCGICAAEHVGVEAVCDAGVSEVVFFGAVAGDAHDDAPGDSGGFLEGAECAPCGVGGDVFGDACGVGDGAEVLHGAGGLECGRHGEVVAGEYLDGDVGEGYLEGVVGFFLGELHIPGCGADLDELELSVVPV